MELGMDLKQINVAICNDPKLTSRSLERKIKPLVEFLLDLGVPKACIPKILSQRPQLCGLSLSKNVISSMIFLEDLGVDNKKWAKVISCFPQLLCVSRQKVQAVVDFLCDLHPSRESIGKILTQLPNVVSSSVEDNLHPKVEYFISSGVDVAILICKAPKTFGISIEVEDKVKPLTHF